MFFEIFIDHLNINYIFIPKVFLQIFSVIYAIDYTMFNRFC